MYYRVAIQTNSSPVLKWKSTAMCSLDVLLQFLRLYRALPAHSLRIFVSPARDNLDEMLLRENNGFDNYSVTAEQFLRVRHLHVWETEKAEQATPETQTIAGETTTISSEIAMLASSMTGNVVLAPAYALNPLDRRRQEIEFGTVGDHDCPYVFSFPQSITEMRAWMKLLEKVQCSPIEL
ncbi:MAG: hypothetical protein ABI406_18260 [Ktedonobacteraceae bacterium]